MLYDAGHCGEVTLNVLLDVEELSSIKADASDNTLLYVLVSPVQLQYARANYSFCSFLVFPLIEVFPCSRIVATESVHAVNGQFGVSSPISNENAYICVLDDIVIDDTVEKM